MHRFTHVPAHVPTHVPQATRLPLVRVLILVAAAALLALMLAATTLVAEAAGTSEAPLVPQTVEGAPQRLPVPEDADLAGAAGGGDQWPWAIVAVVLVALASGNYVVARCVAPLRESSHESQRTRAQ